MARFILNGKNTALDVDPSTPLLWALRDELGCASVKYGCGAGQCCACLVVLDGVPQSSCLVTVGDADGRDVRTLEGYVESGAAAPVVDALLAVDAGQCGYCLPGIATALTALRMRVTEVPTRADVVRVLDGHLCRCGSQVRIIDAACAALGVVDG